MLIPEPTEVQKRGIIVGPEISLCGFLSHILIFAWNTVQQNSDKNPAGLFIARLQSL